MRTIQHLRDPILRERITILRDIGGMGGSLKQAPFGSSQTVAFTFRRPHQSTLLMPTRSQQGPHRCHNEVVMTAPPPGNMPGWGPTPSWGHPAAGQPVAAAVSTAKAAPTPLGGYATGANMYGELADTSASTASWNAKPGIIALRPHRGNEIFDNTFAVIRTRAGVTLGLSASIAGLWGLLNWLIHRFLPTFQTPQVGSDREFMPKLIASALILLVLYICMGVLLNVMTLLAADAALGHNTPLADLRRRTFSRFGTTVGLAVLAWAASAPMFAWYLWLSEDWTLTDMLWTLTHADLDRFWQFIQYQFNHHTTGWLFFCCSLLGVIRVAIPWWFASHVATLEHSGWRQSLRRSQQLTKTGRVRSWRMAVSLLLFACTLRVTMSLGLTSLLGQVQSIMMVHWLNPLLQHVIVTSIWLFVVMPLFAGVTALSYIDQRIRREGLEVTLMRSGGGA